MNVKYSFYDDFKTVLYLLPLLYFAFLSEIYIISLYILNVS